MPPTLSVRGVVFVVRFFENFRGRLVSLPFGNEESMGRAMANGRCRLHGGKSTGPRTPEGAERARQAALRHGFYTAEAKIERRNAGSHRGAAALRPLEREDWIVPAPWLGAEYVPRS
jgi:hypothetical protein